MRDGLSSWCRRCHAGAVRRSKEKARARALLEEARFHVEVADEFGDHEWRHKRAASLREESEENPRRKLYAKSDRLVGGFGELRSARRGVSIVETCPGEEKQANRRNAARFSYPPVAPCGCLARRPPRLEEGTYTGTERLSPGYSWGIWLGAAYAASGSARARLSA
jgi:hypothetical protein